MRTDQMSRRFSSFGHPVPLALAIVLIAMCSGCAGGMAESGGSADPLVGTWRLVGIVGTDGVTPLEIAPTSGWYWTLTFHANRSFTTESNIYMVFEAVDGVVHLTLGEAHVGSGAWTTVGGRVYITGAGFGPAGSSFGYDIPPRGDFLCMWDDTGESGRPVFARVR